MRLARSISAVLLILALANPALAGPISVSVAKAAKELAAEQATKPGGGKNPYLWPGMALIGGGAVLAAVGFLRTTGAEVNIGTNASGTSATVSANEKHNTAFCIEEV